MGKSIAGALVGIVIICLGFYVWYSYMLSLEHGGNYFLFGLAMVNIGTGLYILFWASKKADPYGLKKAQAEAATSTDVLKRSDEIVKGWYKDEPVNKDIKFVTVTPKEPEEPKIGF